MSEPFLHDFKTYPRMVRWFNPFLLRKLLNNVVTSAMFGQYADRRLMVAALDTVPSTKHVQRAQEIRARLQPTGQEEIWVDYVADLGDGFDSTFAVASLLAAPSLTVDGQPRKLPRGQLLVMGGDEVYPLAEQQTYRNQLWQPYSWASPDHDKKSDDGTPLFALPGNHDWYDGLVMFLAYFAREKPMHFGSWRTRQRRSYFAIQLTETWWLWAMDIQLAEDMDQPQADYFKIIADAMPQSARIVLCTAEPGWLYTDTNLKSWGIVEYALSIARKANKAFTVPMLISGDTHHYSRYTAADGTQFVTSGGGGAFLHPTHQLEPAATLGWDTRRQDISLAKLNDRGSEPAVYPSMRTSRRLVWGNVAFAFKNWDFSILMAVVYVVVGMLIGMRNEIDTHLLVFALMAWAIVGYTTTQEAISLTDNFKAWRKRRASQEPIKPAVIAKQKLQTRKSIVVWVTSLIHGGAQFGLAAFAAHLAIQYGPGVTSAWPDVWWWIAGLAFCCGSFGFLGGSTLFGLNMLVTCLCFRMNRNDAFSALRIGRFNNFLRMRISGDEIELYAVGLENVPSRDQWKKNPAFKIGDPSHPKWTVDGGLRPHVIERIVVKGSTTPMPQFP